MISLILTYVAYLAPNKVKGDKTYHFISYLR